MVNYDDCIRCGSKNIDKIMVNTRISLNYPEEKSAFTNSISQRILLPTDALVCKECGHIEFFVDFEK